MRDAVAHLAGPDDADLANRMSHFRSLFAPHLRAVRFGPFLDLDHVDSPSTPISGGAPDLLSA
jgi:hypothetical protein